jgi:phage/plasmid-associated DNA primase
LVYTSFADVWLRDPNARTLERIVFDPSRPPGLIENDTIWNNWPGIAAAALPPSNNNHPTRLDLLFGHIQHVLCDGKPDHADWLLDYFASIVQRPWQKTMVALVFTGPQGAGKNTLLDFFRERVLGPAITTQLQDPQRGLLDPFGSLHENRIFVQIDEADRLGSAENALKHLITGDTTTIRRLFLDHALVPNYTNLVLTTNSPCPVHIPPAERRFVLFKVSGAHVGDRPYFDALHAELATAARPFYDFLMARALPNNENQLQATRPITDHYLACCRTAIDPFKRFLSALINQRPYTDVFAADLYADYLDFFTDTGAAHPSESGRVLRPLSLVAFAAALLMYSHISRRRTRAGIVYCFGDFDALRDALAHAQELDPDVFLMRPARPSAQLKRTLLCGGGR